MQDKPYFEWSKLPKPDRFPQWASVRAVGGPADGQTLTGDAVGDGTVMMLPTVPMESGEIVTTSELARFAVYVYDAAHDAWVFRGFVSDNQ